MRLAIPDRRSSALLAAALLVYAVCCLLGPKGLLSASHGTDVSLYEDAARNMVHGRLPYRDFYLEYPPGALAAFLVPAVSFAHYVVAFKLLMALCGAAALVLVERTARLVALRPVEAALALAIVATAPVSLGSVFLNRYDVFPALLTSAALLALLVERDRIAAALLALGTVAKIYPGAALPAAGVATWFAGGRRRLKRALAVFVAVAAVVTLPFAALGPGGLAFSFYVQATRHLQVESFFGSILLAAGKVGIYRPQLAFGKPGSLDLFGTLPSTLGVLSTVAEVAAILAAAVWFARGGAGRRRLVLAVVAAVGAYVAFGKVISPQYLVWLVPLVPLVGGLVAPLLLVASLVLTQVEYSHYHSLASGGGMVWVLLARNVVLVALALLLLVRVRRAAGRP